MLTQDNRIKKNSYLWNTASGMINAGQSALILVFIPRFLSHDMGGVFSISYALGNLFSTMGKYGVRNYQVTDIKDNISFANYRKSRFITGFTTTVVMLLYLLFKYLLHQYSLEKSLTVLLICLWKLIDTFEDVYYGMYQQRGRLDIGAKYYTIRLLFSTALFCILVVFKLSLLTCSLFVFLTSAALSAIFIYKTIGSFDVDIKGSDFSQIKDLLIKCFPLFASTSLSIYIGNAPKYCIDSYMDEKTQAIFGYIMMPAFVIMVMNQFVYQPIIRDLAELWQDKKSNSFRNKVLKQYVVVALITVVVVLGGVLVGIPLLSLLYNVQLSSYKLCFIVMLLGGGFYALVSFLTVVLTVMRDQNKILVGYVLATAASFAFGKLFVVHWKLMGASFLYLTLNLVLTIFFTVIFLGRNRKV